MPLDTVYLENLSWTKITVEALIGNNSNPESNESLGSKLLKRNESWKIDSEGEDIYYHRDANPDNPDGSMTLWTHRPCYGNGSVYHEKL